ncbi:MAG: long-chain fatty acid--CoA ligase, partial [Desulfobacterales bacterium]|nr:long-chain fatty acid--CoA ligase [Desulfobacterales bacterium]
MGHQNLSLLFQDRVATYKDKTFIIRKQGGRWNDVSWNQVSQEVKKNSLGLISLGLKKRERVAILSETRAEWLFAYLAILASGGVLAPIYHTNSPDQCHYVINDSGARFAFVEDQEQLDKFLEFWEHMPGLEKIIVFEKYEPADDNRIMSLQALTDLGVEWEQSKDASIYWERLKAVQADDLSALVYTSGTTGRPKGTIITHQNLLASADFLNTALPTNGKDRGLAFLPMAHVAEMLLFWVRVLAGQQYAYAEDVFSLPRDIVEVEPTFFMSTPRFFEKYYNQIWGTIEEAPWFRRAVIDLSLKIGNRVKECRQMKSAIPWYLNLLSGLAYLVTFRKIRKMFGGRIKTFLSAGAPIADKIVHFFASIGLPIYEAYGLTETAASGSYNTREAYRFGSVGKPIKGIKVKINADGEILIKSPGNCVGYYNQPEKTAGLFEDGFLRTGDVGYFDEDGFLFITDRKKDIFINTSGKNITPSYIENLMKTSRYISQIMVYGDQQPYITALVTLDEVETVKYARDSGVVYTGFADLTHKAEIIALIDQEIKTRNKELSHPEQIRRFSILEKELRQNDEEVTPTMKVKR